MTNNGDQQPPSHNLLSSDGNNSYSTSIDQDMGGSAGGGGIDELMDQASFWDKLRSFGTDEKDDLVEKFRTYTQTTLSDKGIKFFLEMVNWNLQAAIGAFYDFEQPRNDVEPGFQLVSDITVGDGEAVTPDTRFVKRWRVKNVGTSEWSEGTVLRHLQGDITPITPIVNVGRLLPGCSTEVSVSMMSPNTPGTFRSVWRAHDVYGLPFGDPIWVIVTVDDCGILGITQQLNDCHALGNRDDSLLVMHSSDVFDRNDMTVKQHRNDQVMTIREFAATLDDIPFKIEIALQQQLGAVSLPFPGMDKSGAAVCELYVNSPNGCPRGSSCPFRHIRGEKSIVCKHWLRGLCKKGDECEFLHEYDISRMPECYFYSKFGQCMNKECIFLHLDPESKIKDCPW